MAEPARRTTVLRSFSVVTTEPENVKECARQRLSALARLPGMKVPNDSGDARELSRSEWIERCAQRLSACAFTAEGATTMARSAWYDFYPRLRPEQAADEICIATGIPPAGFTHS